VQCSEFDGLSQLGMIHDEYLTPEEVNSINHKEYDTVTECLERLLITASEEGKVVMKMR